MKHDASNAPRSDVQRWILATLAVLTVGFGTWGSLEYAHLHHEEIDFFTALYYAAQLLLAHGHHLEGDIPWTLALARYLGLALIFTAGVMAFLRFVRDRARRNHVVICGLGALGLRLALDARRRGLFVIGVEKRESGALDEARAMGVTVVEGDATRAGDLREARVERAETLVAVCSDDETNREIVLQAAALVAQARARRKPLLCRLLIRDPKLREPLVAATAAGRKDAHDPRRLQIHADDLDLQDTAARQALRQFPLDFRAIREADATTVHLVVVGFGPMGQALALHAARVGHFANGAKQERKIRVTVVEKGAADAVAAFRRDHPAIDHVCRLEASEAERTPKSLLPVLDGLSRTAAERDELVTYAVCLETKQLAEDSSNLAVAFEVTRWAESRPVQTLVFQNTRLGYESLLATDADGMHRSPRFHPFGMIEEVFTWDVLLHESEDVVARALHEDYRASRTRDGVPDSENPSWEALPAGLKDSNRQAADHVAVKLRALGYHHEALRSDAARVERFTDAETELLARMEHQRWCAERWLAGWTLSDKTVRVEKKSASLVPWDALPEAERVKDRQQVLTIPRALHGAGRGIYR
jgi:hypothetical protein